MRLTLLDDAQIEQLHRASLDILEGTGITFKHPDALAQFRQAGCLVHDERVCLDRSVVEQALATTPSCYTLKSRYGVADVTVGGDNLAVMPAGGPPFIYDLDRRRRPGTLTDLRDLIKIAHTAPRINVMARKLVDPPDIPPETRHLLAWHACLTLSDKPVQSGFAGGRREAEEVLELLALAFGGEDQLRGVPRAQTNVNVNSPLVYDGAMLEGLLAFAQWGQPVQISPFVMAGVTGPSTLAGALAQHNAEILAGMVLTQLVNPGTPVLYGSATSNVDLRTGAPATGSPESAASVAISAQFARFHGLPSRGGGALSDAPVPDQQSAYERMMLLMTSVLSGVNFVMHGAGILESYLTVSPAQMAMDLEMLDMLATFLAPLDIDDTTLALDTIDEVGPGGMFLQTSHTLARYRDVHFLPVIGLRKTYEQWQSEGGESVLTRAENRCREMLDRYRPPEVPAPVRDAMDDYVDKRVGRG